MGACKRKRKRKKRVFWTLWTKKGGVNVKIFTFTFSDPVKVVTFTTPVNVNAKKKQMVVKTWKREFWSYIANEILKIEV